MCSPAARGRGAPEAGCVGWGETAGARGGEQRKAAVLEAGPHSRLERGFIIYGAVLQPLLCHPCTPNVCQLERTSEVPPASWEAREGLQEGLMEVFLALVRENA